MDKDRKLSPQQLDHVQLVSITEELWSTKQPISGTGIFTTK